MYLQSMRLYRNGKAATGHKINFFKHKMLMFYQFILNLYAIVVEFAELKRNCQYLCAY